MTNGGLLCYSDVVCSQKSSFFYILHPCARMTAAAEEYYLEERSMKREETKMEGMRTRSRDEKSRYSSFCRLFHAQHT